MLTKLSQSAWMTRLSQKTLLTILCHRELNWLFYHKGFYYIKTVIKGLLTNLLHRTLLTIEAVIEEITHETVNWGFNILKCHRPKKITDGTVTDDISDSTDTDGNIDWKVIRNIDDITN